GNHDRHGSQKDFSRLLEHMRANSIFPLINEEHIINMGETKISLYASDDIRTSIPDLSFFDNANADKFVIFFPHSPDILPEVLQKNRKAFDLALCGHTHGGQIALFGKALHSSSEYKNRYLSGWKEEKKHRFFITNGVGTSLIPVRIGARPQMHAIILVSEQARHLG
ncbi:MAG: hypothetical protein Q4E07_02610, partial [Eubacteriales bacterium]|nr:hypothetical protein [Eubacteriales bacterium]